MRALALIHIKNNPRLNTGRTAAPAPEERCGPGFCGVSKRLDKVGGIYLKPRLWGHVIARSRVLHRRKPPGFVAIEEILERSGVENGKGNEKSPGFIIFIIIICLVSELVFCFLWTWLMISELLGLTVPELGSSRSAWLLCFC